MPDLAEQQRWPYGLDGAGALVHASTAQSDMDYRLPGSRLIVQRGGEEISRPCFIHAPGTLAADERRMIARETLLGLLEQAIADRSAMSFLLAISAHSRKVVSLDEFPLFDEVQSGGSLADGRQPDIICRQLGEPVLTIDLCDDSSDRITEHALAGLELDWRLLLEALLKSTRHLPCRQHWGIIAQRHDVSRPVEKPKPNAVTASLFGIAWVLLSGRPALGRCCFLKLFGL